MRKHNQKPKRQPPAIYDYLRPFVPLFLNQGADVLQEELTNKAFFLGRKEYVFRPTLAGHIPESDRDPVMCRECGGFNIIKRHHKGDFRLPECWFWECDDCGKQWGQE